MRALGPRSFAAFLWFSGLVPAASEAWPTDPGINLPVCATPGDQTSPQIVSDGAGGAIIVWADTRDSQRNIYAQRVSAVGARQWAPDGIALSAAGTVQPLESPVAVPDGAGGAIALWIDSGPCGCRQYVRVQRVDALGVPRWGPDGVLASEAYFFAITPQVAADGAGGAFLAYVDGVYNQVVAQHLDAFGRRLWTPNGASITTSINAIANAVVAGDGTGGAVISWQDQRSHWSNQVFAQRLNDRGEMQWPVNGVRVCPLDSLAQWLPAIAADGQGGAIITWHDQRGGPGAFRDFAQRLSASGLPRWAPDGVTVGDVVRTQQTTGLLPDGAGGAFLAWVDTGDSIVHVQHLDAAGARRWGDAAVPLSTAGHAVVDGWPRPMTPRMAADGQGGVVVAWSDIRNGNVDVYAQHVDAMGLRLWDEEGVPICVSPAAQSAPAMITDGSGSAIVAWQDLRGADWDIYAQRIQHSGRLGRPDPWMAAVRDVPGDQGGRLEVLWDASELDTLPVPGVHSYVLWRRMAGGAAWEALSRGARVADGHEARSAPAPGTLRATRDGATTIYWEYLVTIPAVGHSGYGYTVSTAGDSTPGSVPWDVFVVDAIPYAGIPYDSSPDSGYSVDNLAPPAPAPFIGTYANGAATLTWAASDAPDFALYRIHRGSTPDFEPGPENLVVEQGAVGYTDHAGAPYLYKLSAVDRHGNEGPATLCVPGGVAGVPGADLLREAWLSPPSPNPGRDRARFSFGLPRAGRASLVLYDQQGRAVRVLFEGQASAGGHVVGWDGRDQAGHPVADGLYFCRLRAEGRSITRKLATIR